MELSLVGGTDGQAADKVAPQLQLVVHAHCDVEVPPGGSCEGML